MPKTIPIDIGHLSFKSKKDALNFLKEILNTYSVGDEVNVEHEKILKMALEKHPSREIKIGAGIEKFVVDFGDFRTKCFWIVRVDGTKVNFSYKACLA